jgi:hypothetical protein
MQDYERKSIPDVIEEIKFKYFLPDIQRNLYGNLNKCIHYLIQL